MNNLLEQKCFDAHSAKNIACRKKECKNWIKCGKHLNCVLISAKDGPKTLQEIGEVFSLTRMRICQIEKSILGKLKSSLPD
jgi:hypothetical protein